MSAQSASQNKAASIVGVRTGRHGSGSSSGRHGEHQTFWPCASRVPFRRSARQRPWQRTRDRLDPPLLCAQSVERCVDLALAPSPSTCPRLEVAVSGVSARRVESFEPGRSPGSRSAPRRDRAHANPGAQAGAGSPTCASPLLPPPHGHAVVMAAPFAPCMASRG